MKPKQEHFISKAKIALPSIAVLGIAVSIVAFKVNYTKQNNAYYTFAYNKQTSLTFTKATAIPASSAFPGPVYYTLTKNAIA